MTDNYRDEMREALELGREYAKGALAAHDAVYQGHSATEAERVMIVDDIAKLDAALSRLSASGQGERDRQARISALMAWMAMETARANEETGRGGWLTDHVQAMREYQAELDALLQPAAPAPEKGNPQMADECVKACDRIGAMDEEQVGAILDKPEKGEKE